MCLLLHQLGMAFKGVSVTLISLRNMALSQLTDIRAQLSIGVIKAELKRWVLGGKLADV